MIFCAVPYKIMYTPRILSATKTYLCQNGIKKKCIKNIECIAKRTLTSTKINYSSQTGLSYIHNVGEQPLKYKTIGQCLEEAANKWPEKPWIVSYHESVNLTFSQVLEEADKLAAGLIECGFQPGDRIGLAAPNYSKWIVSMMAAARAGLILVAINPVYTETELCYSLEKVGAKGLIMPYEYKSYKYYEMMKNITPELVKCKPGQLKSSKLPNLKAVIILDDIKLPGTFTFNDVKNLANLTTMQRVSELQGIIQSDDGCNIQFTSGTTGKPKGAFLSHNNFVNNSFLIGKRNELHNDYHKICVQVPLFHAYGIVINIMPCLHYGTTLVLPAPFYSPTESMKAIIDEKCTIITGTPTMHVDLVHKVKSSNVKLTTPEIALSGGALCSPMLFKQIKEVLNVLKVKSLFGMTETSAVIFQSLKEENIQQITETVGHVQEHTEAKVVDTNGKIVPFNTPGELWIRGYCNMLGYWQDPAKTTEMISPDGWLRTGDQFILQEDGYGKIVGRLKDVIIRGGENIFPKEIENHINTHPDIVESHVFGVNDERLGEEVCAAVRVKDGSRFDHNEMKGYCQGKLSHFKIPRTSEVAYSYYHNKGERPLQNSTIGDALEKAANTWPGQDFLISEPDNLKFTFEDTLRQADKLASAFLKCGLKPNDRIGVFSTNTPNFLLTIMAASRIGLIMVAINPAIQSKELKYCLNKVGVKCLLIPSKIKSQNNFDILKKAIPEIEQSRPGEINCTEVPSLESIIISDNQHLNGTFKFNDIMNMGNENDISLYKSEVTPESIFSILFTSGTTGLPKAAMQSHFSYMNNSLDVGYRIDLDKKQHRVCLQIPFFHAFGLLMTLASLQHGSTLIIPSRVYNSSEAIRSILKNKCTLLTGTPTMYVDMLKRQNEEGVLMTTPEMVVTGGAPCSPQLFKRVKQEFGVTELRSVYGMTEVCSAMQSMPHEDMYYATETVGRVMDHMEVKIVDTEGRIVPLGTPGELLIRSYSNMAGYWDDEKKTKETIDSNNWLRTGDQFILEEDGYGMICGRLKDIIIRGGENIVPKEIEDFLNTHPDVLETQVFGVKDDRLGEEICASVRIKQGSMFDYNKLKIYCKDSIAHFKIPKYLKIVEDFPKTASGKVQKYKLKEMVESGYM